MTFTMLWTVIFLISGMFIVICDTKYKEFSSLALIANYYSMCMLTTPWLLIGFVAIIMCYFYKSPVDPLYVFVLCYLILITKLTMPMLLGVAFMMLVILDTKEGEDVSFMAPLELALATVVLG